MEKKPKISAEDAIKNLEHIELFYLQQAIPDQPALDSLIRLKRDIEAKRIYSMGLQVQQTITSYFEERDVAR